MNQEQRDALAKVHKLLRLADSDNQHESMLAAQRAEEIMMKYEIKQAMLDLPEKVEEEIMDFGPKGAPLHAEARLPRWAYRIADPIATAHACKLYKSGSNLEIIGRASDVDTVRYLFAWASIEAQTQAAVKGAGCGTVWKNNYLDGFGAGLREAMKKGKEDAIKSLKQENALVLVENAVAKLERRMDATTDWQKRNKPLYRGKGGGGRYDGNAHAEGKRDGAAFNPGGASARIGGTRKKIGGK